MSRIFFHDDGQPSPNPTSRAQARTLQRLKYDDRLLCARCGECSIKHTAGARCVHCARIDASAFYQLAVVGVPWPDGEPLPEDMAEALALSPAGFPSGGLWVSPEPCAKRGHLGLRTESGDCWTCSQPSRRKVAMQAGETKYRPRDPCPHCGTQALRRVDNGRCDGCTDGLTADDLALLGM